MAKSHQLQSLFCQKLDRSVFGMYFIGAIVPLFGLGLVTQRYALPVLEEQVYGVQMLVAGMVGVGSLTLTAFFALRRITRSVLTRMDADNDRLAQILEASQSLANAPHAQVVGDTTLACARKLSGAQAAYLFIGGSDKPLSLSQSVGPQAQSLYQSAQSQIDELAESALHEGRSITLAGGSGASGSEGLAAAAAVPLSSEMNTSGVVVLASSKTPQGFGPEQIDAVSTLVALTSVALHNTGLQEAQRNFFAHVTEILVAALDAHVDRRANHATQVAQLANRVGREMQLGEAELQRLHFSSLLHDIGMLKIDRVHQRKEAHFRKHPLVGHRMLNRIKLWEDVAPIVLYHHERWDGAGYPEGLAGESIPLEARIICVADAFDAMTRDELDRPALTREEAFEELRRCKGKQFDPAIVDALLRLAEHGDVPI